MFSFVFVFFFGLEGGLFGCVLVCVSSGGVMYSALLWLYAWICQ